MKLGWAKTADRVEVPEEETAPAYELAAVDLVSTTGRWSGWIATDGERTSDWLNHADEVVVHGLEQIPLDAQVADLGLPVGGSLTPTRLKPAEVVLVVPPPLPPNRHLRLHRRKVRIVLDVGDFRITGQLHVRPGAAAGDYILRSSRTMVPLTEVELVHNAEPEFRRLLDVLIVNAQHVTRMVESEQAIREAQARPVPTEPVAPTAPAAPSPASVSAEPAAPESGAEGESRIGPVARQRLMSALGVLLDAGVIDIDEFQVKRAEIRARGSAAGL